MSLRKPHIISIIALSLIVLFSACASSSQGYKPKYKKPDPNKPLPCPQKDC